MSNRLQTPKMTMEQAIEEVIVRCLRSDMPGIPWLARPVRWAGLGRALAVDIHGEPTKRGFPIVLLKRPDDSPSVDVPEGNEDWEVIPCEVWQKERRHGAN